MRFVKSAVVTDLPFTGGGPIGSNMRIADIGKSWRFDRKAARAGIQHWCGDRLLLSAEPAAGGSARQ
jgi:hypothetical protein